MNFFLNLLNECNKFIFPGLNVFNMAIVTGSVIVIEKLLQFSKSNVQVSFRACIWQSLFNIYDLIEILNSLRIRVSTHSEFQNSRRFQGDFKEKFEVSRRFF